MRFSLSTGCGYPEHLNYDSLPDDVINVPDADYYKACRRKANEKLDVIDGKLVVVPVVLPMDDWCKLAEQRMQTERDKAINQTIVSQALGSAHVYQITAGNIQNLNGLITLGRDSKFTCTDADGIKARRLHSLAQLRQVASDMEAHVSAQFDRYEQKLAAIASAKTAAELDRIVW